MPTDENDLLASIDRKLSVLISVTAYQMVHGMKIAEGAPLLRRLGLDRREIAAIFDSTAAAISVRLAEARKEPRGRKTT